MSHDGSIGPVDSEFETDDQAASYDRCFRGKVKEAMLSAEPRLPHDEAMARVEAMLSEKRACRADRPLER